MTKEELEKLYKNKVLPESQKPFHFIDSDNKEFGIEAFNPICGDRFELYLKGEDKKQLFFKGEGCAISKASCSLLCRIVEGKSLAELKVILEMIINSNNESGLHLINSEALITLNEMKNFESRQDCVRLSWDALYRHIKVEG